MVVGGGTGGAGASTSHSLRMRGLPYQANEQDVEAFFEGFKVAKAVVVRKNGKPTGEGYAFFHSEQEASAALQRKNRESMGNRYIELFWTARPGVGPRLAAGERAPKRLARSRGAAAGERLTETLATRESLPRRPAPSRPRPLPSTAA